MIPIFLNEAQVNAVLECGTTLNTLTMEKMCSIFSQHDLNLIYSQSAFLTNPGECFNRLGFSKSVNSEVTLTEHLISSANIPNPYQNTLMAVCPNDKMVIIWICKEVNDTFIEPNVMLQQNFIRILTAFTGVKPYNDVKKYPQFKAAILIIN